MCRNGNAGCDQFFQPPDFVAKNRVKKVLPGRLYQAAIRGHLMRIRRPGKNLGHGTEKETGSPLLAKRIIVAAFAALAIGLLPLALPGERDLFVDFTPAPEVLAAN